ncbi:MAG: YedE family putative selenium transporter [Bilophila sp.]
MKNPLATTPGIIVVGAVIGLIAAWLQKLGIPQTWASASRASSATWPGGLGLHRAAIVQYLRPEIMGLVLGSLAAALATREFKPRGGSAPLVRFVLGIIAAMGALVFLGCPWRAILRLAGGDGNAILGLAGLATGIWIGTLFFKRGYSLGRSNGQSAVSGALFPALIVGLLLLYLVFPQVPGEPQSGPLFYSVKGPGSRTRLIASLGLAFVIGSSRSAAASARWGLSAISSFPLHPPFPRARGHVRRRLRRQRPDRRPQVRL